MKFYVFLCCWLWERGLCKMAKLTLFIQDNIIITRIIDSPFCLKATLCDFGNWRPLWWNSACSIACQTFKNMEYFLFSRVSYLVFYSLCYNVRLTFNTPRMFAKHREIDVLSKSTTAMTLIPKMINKTFLKRQNIFIKSKPTVLDY